MPETESSRESDLTVVITYAPLATTEAVGRIEQVHPSVQVRVAGYVEPQQLRVARELGRDRDELQAMSPPLSAHQTSALARADVLLAMDVPLGIRALAPRLAWIQEVAAGVEHLAPLGLADAGIALTNGSGVGSDSIAEFVMARLLEHWKRLPEIATLQRNREWKACYGRRAAGRTVAIVGLGAIGLAVARFARAFGMRTLGLVRTPPGEETAASVDAVFAGAEWAAALGQADAVVLAATGSRANERLFGAEAFAAMAADSYFVNVSRGSLVDEDALIDALTSGHLGGAALDVVLDEPLDPGSPLWGLDNVALSFHSSTSLERYDETLVALFCDNLRRHIDGRPLQNLRSTGR